MRQSLRSRANPGRISIALGLSYVLDWVIIVAAAGIGAVFSYMTPNKRPFTLANPEISFPHVEHEKISTVVLAICGLVAPAAIIFVVAILLVPGPTVPKSTPKSLIWKRKLWEWHTGWLGLGLSLSAAFLITSGMKNLFGKPRPDLISRCDPDLDNFADHVVGGLNFTGMGIGQLVYQTICRNKDKEMMDDAFRSYPSGHSSFSAAGLIYLSLFLATKLGTIIPFLPPQAYSADESRFSAFPSRAAKKAAELRAAEYSRSNSLGAKNYQDSGEHQSQNTGHDEKVVAARNQAAAPPVYLLVFTIVPWFASIYIASTRYSDFRHHGFDILFGYFIGTVTAIFAFRYYHLPISQGAGWAWGPRSGDRSFWAGIGVGNYAGHGSRVSEPILKEHVDLEPGLPDRRDTNDDHIELLPMGHRSTDVHGTAHEFERR